MSKDYKEITKSLSAGLGKVKKELPDMMSAFSSLAQSATKTGELDKTTKELIALAIGIAKQCDACIGFHTQALVQLGVSRAAFLEMLNIAVYMGGGPALMYATEALQAFDTFGGEAAASQ